MSVSIVNGYVCFSCCDAAKAKRGENPAQKPGDIDDPSKHQPGQASRDAAVTFGGQLAGLNASAASGAGTASPGVAPQNVLDVSA